MNSRAAAHAGLAAVVAVAWSLEPEPPPVRDASSNMPAGIPPPRAAPEPREASAGPLRVRRPPLEPASRDPFAPAAAPVIVASVAPSPAPEPALPNPKALPPAQAPEPPPLNLQFAGSITSPGGELVVLATDGTQTWTLEAGLLLPNGFRVDAITPEAVQFTHASLGAPARLDLPPAPAFELR